MPEFYEAKNGLLNQQPELNIYKELPNNKAFAIINLEFEIVFCNDSFNKLFNLSPGENLDLLPPNSDFLSLLKGFKDKKFRNLSSDIILSLPGKYESSLYQIGIDRVFLSKNQYFFVVVNHWNKGEHLKER